MIGKVFQFRFKTNLLSKLIYSMIGFMYHRETCRIELMASCCLMVTVYFVEDFLNGLRTEEINN